MTICNHYHSIHRVENVVIKSIFFFQLAISVHRISQQCGKFKTVYRMEVLGYKTQKVENLLYTLFSKRLFFNELDLNAPLAIM